MHVALGYHWFATSAAYHLERALLTGGHRVTYVGMPCGRRAGYDSATSLGDVLDSLPELPDLYLWVDPASRYFPPGIEDLPVPTACYLIDVHLGAWREQVAPFFDAVFIAQKGYVPRFRHAVGHDQVYWLPLAAAPDVHSQWDLPRTYDVGFVGNIALAHKGTARSRRLKAIAERYCTNDFYRQYSPEEVGQVYSQSRIVFNTSIAGDVTMRVFEGTACGALVLTDRVENGLDELYVPGREIVTYQDDADLLGKMDYYLVNEAARSQVARAGQQRTLAEHTYTHRAQQIVATISSSQFRRLAPMRRQDPGERWAARRSVYTHLHMLDALFDGARAAGYHPIRRIWVALPCLVRRALL